MLRRSESELVMLWGPVDSREIGIARTVKSRSKRAPERQSPETAPVKTSQT